MSTPINDALVASRATRSSDRSGAPDTHLHGRRLILARVAWVVAVSMVLALFLATLPAYYTLLQTVCSGALCGAVQPTPDSAQAMQKLGLSIGAYATFILVLTLALAFLCFAVSAVIFWRKSDDWMALLVALTVATTVTLSGSVYGTGMNSAWGVLAMVFNVLTSGLYVLVLLLFPDGRFVPRWTRWLLLCGVVAALLSFMSNVYNLVFYAVLGMILIAQVYRYRTASSPLQRQQGKWFIFGGIVVVIIIVGLMVPQYIFPSFGQAGSFYLLVNIPIYIVISLYLPLCIGLAMLRYRLWDIDLIIHRTLVYSTLTVLLAFIYQVSVFTFQSLLGGLTLIGGNQVTIFASTLLIGLLFKPLYDRTRALIDRRFYRRKYDAAQTLAAFSATIRDEVDLNQLGINLMAVVEETMQPAHVSLWLCTPKRYLEEATRALPIIDTESKP
ncbi:MAG: hypothetical protein ACXVCM_01885 [Ktedonobacteraceae bacterium]